MTINLDSTPSSIGGVDWSQAPSSQAVDRTREGLFSDKIEESSWKDPQIAAQVPVGFSAHKAATNANGLVKSAVEMLQVLLELGCFHEYKGGMFCPNLDAMRVVTGVLVKAPRCISRLLYSR